MRHASCVLLSGGVESCVLVSTLAENHCVYPLRVHYGLRWEEEERKACERFLMVLFERCGVHTEPLTVVKADAPADARPVWSLRGPIPGADSSDAAVHLPRRNTLLLDSAARFCAERRISRIAIGTLAGNPFPDATSAFLKRQEWFLSQRYGFPLEIVAPFSLLTKKDVVRQGTERSVPLEYSLSCLAPSKRGIYCGNCNKCAERQRAFEQADVPDLVRRAVEPYFGVGRALEAAPHG